eukprot:6485856-Amphidinium_carterae.1
MGVLSSPSNPGSESRQRRAIQSPVSRGVVNVTAWNFARARASARTPSNPLPAIYPSAGEGFGAVGFSSRDYNMVSNVTVPGLEFKLLQVLTSFFRQS